MYILWSFHPRNGNKKNESIYLVGVIYLQIQVRPDFGTALIQTQNFSCAKLKHKLLLSVYLLIWLGPISN